MFPEKEDFIFCYFWSLMYTLVMDDSGGDELGHLFPQFAAKLGSASADGSAKLDSKVSELFTNCFNAIHGIVSSYLVDHPDHAALEELFFGDLAEKLTSHCMKKHAVNKMGNARDLPLHAMVFWSGWAMKTLHTLFDYLVSSSHNDELCAKVLAHWTMKFGNSYFGGYPPVLSDITTESEKVKVFMSLLFKNHADLDTKVVELLTGSLLRFHGDFIELIQKEPNGKFKNVEDHPFVFLVNKACQEAGVSDQTFAAWQAEVRSGFCNKNFPGE